MHEKSTNCIPMQVHKRNTKMFYWKKPYLVLFMRQIQCKTNGNLIYSTAVVLIWRKYLNFFSRFHAKYNLTISGTLAFKQFQFGLFIVFTELNICCTLKLCWPRRLTSYEKGRKSTGCFIWKITKVKGCGLKRCIFDPILVKPKCVWKAVVFLDFQKIFYIF